MEVSSWENHPFLWAIYTMAMLNNQRVILKKQFSVLKLKGRFSSLALRASWNARGCENSGAWNWPGIHPSHLLGSILELFLCPSTSSTAMQQEPIS